MKKYLLSFLLLGFLTPGITFAARDIACVKNAVNTRESSIISAYTKFNTSMVSALEKRKTSLSEAWSKTESSERKVARKEAFSTFKSSKKSAASTYKSDKKSAWSTYKTTVVNTCKIPEAAKEEAEKTSEEPSL